MAGLGRISWTKAWCCACFTELADLGGTSFRYSLPLVKMVAVHQGLHDLGNQLMQRIDERGRVDSLNTAQIFGLLSTVLFGDMG